jgi:hypothetical protein
VENEGLKKSFSGISQNETAPCMLAAWNTGKKKAPVGKPGLW